MPPACPQCVAPFRPDPMAIGCGLLLVACVDGAGGKWRPRRPLLLVRSEMKPVEEAQVRDTIGLFLFNERKNKIIANDMSALRSSAKIDCIGDFSEAKKELKNAAN